MKKTVSYLMWLALSISLIGFSACSDKDEPEVEPLPEAFFKIEEHSFEISAEAQTFDVRIHTNVKASFQILENIRTWVSVGFSGQTDDYLSYQISVRENTESSVRKGNVVFTPVLVPGVRITDESFLGGNTIIITQAGVGSK